MLPSLSTPQEIMLLVINAQTADSVWRFTVQSELRGHECPLGRDEGVVGNEKTPTLSFAAKWDTDQILSHQVGKLKGFLCRPDVLSSRIGRQKRGSGRSMLRDPWLPSKVGWTGSWDMIRSYKKLGILEIGWAGRQLSKTGWKRCSGSEERNESRSSKSRKVLLLRQNEIDTFPFFLCLHLWECCSGGYPEDLLSPCYFTATLQPCSPCQHHPGQNGIEEGWLSAPDMGTGAKNRVWALLLLRFLVGNCPGSPLRLPCVSSKAKI